MNPTWYLILPWWVTLWSVFELLSHQKCRLRFVKLTNYSPVNNEIIAFQSSELLVTTCLANTKRAHRCTL